MLVKGSRFAGEQIAGGGREMKEHVYEWSLGSRDFRLRFAWLSHRGYYPDDPDKANQDAHRVVPSFGGSPERFLMCVFDGHGETGDSAAQFCRDNIEATLRGIMKEA